MSGFGKKELLGKICHKITDGTHKTPAYQDSGIVFLSAKNIKNGTLSLADHKYISEEEHLELTKRCKPEAGDVMLSKSGSLGDAITVPNLPFSFSIFESLALIKPKRDILSAEYLQQYLNSPLSKRYFWSITSGIGVKHLHLVDLRKMPIHVPSLGVQAQITGVLDIWDDAIEKTEALIAAKEKQFEWLLNNLIEDDFKSCKKTLSEYASIAKKEKILSADGEKLLTVKLHCKGIEPNTRDIKVVLSSKGRPYYQRLAGEFLIGRQNFHNGGFGIVPSELDGFIASNAITTLELNQQKLIPEYLFFHFSRKNYYLRVGHIMDGTGQKELSDKQIMKLPISAPSIKVQQDIVLKLSSAKEEIKLLQTLLDKYRSQKRGLMQKLLTGEWQVSSSQPVAEDMYQEASA